MKYDGDCKCAFCGNEFEKTKTRKIYCNRACYIKANNEKKSATWKSSTPKESAKKDVKIKTSASLAAINRQARAAGMTYGQYVQKNGIIERGNNGKEQCFDQYIQAA